MTRPKVLFTTVCRPFGLPGDGPSVGVDVMKGQLCVAQGALRTSGVGWAYGLEYLAANIRSPAVVLHWPSVSELRRELRRGRYEIVGITSTFQLLPRLEQTVALIREVAPTARVVLGGYGTAAEETHSLGDDVCTGEGIAFIRRLLGERRGEPVVHPEMVYGNQLLSLPIQAGRKAVICTGLGCPNACDFCASSHFFRRQYRPLVHGGDEIFAVMDGIHRRTGVDEFMVLDENFLADRPRAGQLADALERSGRAFEFFTFATVKTLADYSADELVRSGISAVWVGFEGKRSGYDKLHGETLTRLCERLRQHGILVCGSMIVGFDYQTPQLVRAELESFLDARPTYLQCLLYGPTPGTELYRRMDREQRWIGGPPGRGGVPHARCDGYRLGFTHPHLSPEQAESLQRHCLDRDLQRGGHSIYRAIETWMVGYNNLRRRREPFLRARAELYRRKLRGCHPLLPLGIVRAPNATVKSRLRQLQREMRDTLGPLRARDQVIARLVLPAAERYTAFALRHAIGQQPKLLRRTYRC